MYIRDNRAIFGWKGFILSLSHSGDNGWRLQSSAWEVEFDDMGARIWEKRRTLSAIRSRPLAMPAVSP